MASDTTTVDDPVVDDTTDVEPEVDAGENPDQIGMRWGDDLIEGFKPTPVDLGGNGEAPEETDTEPEAEETVADEKAEETATEPGTIGEANYADKVEITAKDGSVSYKTVRQLIDEGLFEADYTKKTMELARQREQLSEDQGILKMLGNDQVARDYMMKRLDDIKAGKPMDADDDLDIPAEVLEAAPWIGKLKDKVLEQSIEISKSRTDREQTQASQQVGKIDSVMAAAMTAIAKETGSKLEPDVFRARVGKVILESLNDNIPEEERYSVAGNMILADKDYYLSKARRSYQPEIELAKDKAIDSAKLERAKKAQKPKPLKGGGSSAPVGGSSEFKMKKDKDGRPDMDAFLEDAFTKGGKAR